MRNAIAVGLVAALWACGPSAGGPGGDGGSGGTGAVAPGGDGGAGGEGGEALASPAIARVEPQEGWPSTVVHVYGSGFAPLAVKNRVRFGGVVTPVLSAALDGTALETRVPVEARTGPVSVLVDRGAGWIRVDGPPFTVTAYPAPVLEELRPAVVPVGMASQLEVLGEGFLWSSVVAIDGEEATTHFESSTRLTVDLRGLAEGRHRVAVTSPGVGTSNEAELRAEWAGRGPAATTPRAPGGSAPRHRR
jgi:hypothetical protein